MTLRQASAKQWVKQAEEKLPVWSHQGLRVINQQLWCCCGDAGIVVFDSELQQQRTVPTGAMGWVCDVTVMSNGDIVIAADEGLYYYGSNGEWVIDLMLDYLLNAKMTQQNTCIYK